MPKEWVLDKEWAEDPATQDFLDHLRRKAGSKLSQLLVSCRQGSLEEIRQRTGAYDALIAVIKETTNEPDNDRDAPKI